MLFLVTGGAGRLGCELIELLCKSGCYVRAFDLPDASWDFIKYFDREVLKGNITYPKLVLDACVDADIIVHLAAILPPRSEFDNVLTRRVNVERTQNIVDVIKRRRNIPFIFASSVSTYGITAMEQPQIREGHTLHANNLYAESKIEAERLIRSSGIPYITLRIAPIAVTELLELPEKIPYREDQRVEFVHLADAAQGLFEAARNPEALGEVLNIAGGPSWQMTVTEYITRFYDAPGVDMEPVFSEEYTAPDWYDTSRSRCLGYQRTTFNGFLDRLRVLGEELGLR